jgi:hypothetical protein
VVSKLRTLAPPSSLQSLKLRHSKALGLLKPTFVSQPAVVDESEATYNNLDELLKDEAMAVCGVKLHILPQGFRFNLKTRKPDMRSAKRE